MIVVTDGESDNIQETTDAAVEAKRLGYTMYAVGIGSSVDATELNAIASSLDNVLTAADFSTLSAQFTNLTSQCEGQ